jgi:von Willebrand factor A domain-containing protein 5
VRRGDGAYLLEEKKPDIFKILVGNIPSGERVKIKITYVAEMKSEVSDLKKRFLLPTVVAPRYTPPHNWQSNPLDREFESPMTGARDGYQFSINMSLYMMSDIISITSPTHHSISKTFNGTHGSVGFSQQLHEDFIVNIEVAKPHEPRVCLEINENGDLAAMVTLFPHIQFRDVPCEILFIVDRSGSMSGDRINHARDALQLFMRSLPEDCYFNIIGFGSNYQMLFPRSVKYDDSSLRKATSHIASIKSDLGGTELMGPLRAVFNSPPIRDYPRQVFVITDGQVSNTNQVIQEVEKNNQFCRLFALGLGKDVSHHLVEGIARAGKGTAQFVTKSEDMAPKVLKQLKDAIQPALNNVRVDWGGQLGGQQGNDNTTSAPPPPSGSIVMSLLGYTSPSASEPPKPKVRNFLSLCFFFSFFISIKR